PKTEAALTKAEAVPGFQELAVAGGAAFPAAVGAFDDELDADLQQEALELAAEAEWDVEDLQPDEVQGLADLFPDAESDELADAEITIWDDAGDDRGPAEQGTAGEGAADISPAEQGAAGEGTADVSPAEDDAGADQTPRRPLSLFKRP
ncbi:MAG: hypothetical protein JXA09_17100, partial [Anaerolineae bacterium]|nr:hypothetical protein [Anaerolineae bacterium]